MAGYIGTIPTPQASQTRDSFVAYAGRTTFTTSGYTPGYLDVYLNGVLLSTTDYTATNGSDVVLTTGAALNDELVVIAYTTFEVAKVAQFPFFKKSGTAADFDLTVNHKVKFFKADGSASNITLG